MKKIRELQGGYPRQMDFLLKLQSELFTISDGLLGKLNKDLVLSGAEVVNNGNGTVNIAAGIIYVGSEALRFDGANNVVADGTKTFVKQAAATTDPKVFGDGNTKDTYSEVKVIIGSKTSIVEIAITTSLYTLASYIEDIVNSYAIKGEFKDIYDLDGNFLNNFDASGLGVTPRYSGWALPNGNNGTPNLAGSVRITAGTVLDPGTGSNIAFAHGQQGGEVNHALTVQELPAHNHQLNGGLTGQSYTAQGGSARNSRDAGNPSTTNTGGNQAHNNMQPYIACYTIIKIA